MNGRRVCTELTLVEERLQRCREHIAEYKERASRWGEYDELKEWVASSIVDLHKKSFDLEQAVEKVCG
jgi:hypothetical protein